MILIWEKIKSGFLAFIRNRRAVFAFEILTLAFLLFYLIGFYFIFISKNDSDISVSISKGWGLNKVAQELDSQKVIKSQFYFKIYAWMTDQSKNVKAGDYVFEKGLNIYEIMNMLAEGRVVKDEVVITIPEGYNIYQIVQRLKEADLDTEGRFLSLVKQPEKFSLKYKFLNCDSDEAKFFGCPIDLEGYLFPDTYFFSKKSSAEEIIAKFLDNFEEKVLSKFLYAVYNSDRDLKDFIIMASLIEREVIKSEDMQLISGILWKRFDIGMALQVDASVIYAKCVQSISDCKISEPLLEDLKIKSPYNTYLNMGLPPGAISNPGIQAIEAAIRPQKSDFWYYLSAKDGATIFSKTLEEHNKNKTKYIDNSN